MSLLNVVDISGAGIAACTQQNDQLQCSLLVAIKTADKTAEPMKHFKTSYLH